MRNWAEPAFYIFLGLLFVAVAVSGFSPIDDRVMTAELVDRGPAPAGESVVAYSALSQPAQEAVDEVLREEWTTFSTYDDYEKLEALPRTLYVEKGGEVYRIRTTSADGDGGLFEGLLHDTILAAGGLLLGAAAYVRDQKRRLTTLGLFPVASTAVVLGVNTVRAPDLSVLSWIPATSFGIAVAAPVLIGIAARQRNPRAGGLAVLTLLCSTGVLFLGEAVSPLGVIIGFGLVLIPGAGLGWWLGETTCHPSTTS